MTDIIKILLIEDDQVDAALTQRMLQQGFGDKFTLDWVQDADSGRQAMVRNAHSVYLVDYHLGPDDGLELVQEMVSQGCMSPIILLTGMDNAEFDIEAVRAGATDYLVKDEISAALLTKAIRYALGRQQFQSSLIETKELLRRKNQKLSQLYKTAHQFVDNVSHEFRTPLAVIKEYSAILDEGLVGPINDEQSKFLAIILNRVDDLGLMVNDMLDTSRLEAGLLRTRRSGHGIGKIIEHIAPVLKRKAEVSAADLSIRVDPGLPEVYCDSEKIGRAIINLTINAIKFSGENGQVVLWARRNAATSEVTVGVTDNGPGIVREEMQSIFERFKQVGHDARASTQGFGLGLSIANELVKLNLGKISLESDVGKGSTFSFGVPTCDPLNLFDRWMSYAEEVRDGLSYVSLFVIGCDATASIDLLNQSHEVLMDAVYSEDLLLRTSPNFWTLLAVTSQQEADAIVRRIEQAHQEVNLHRPEEKLPHFACELAGTWELHGQKEQLFDAYKTQFLSGQESGLASFDVTNKIRVAL